MRHLRFSLKQQRTGFVALLLFALAACGGGTGGPSVVAVPGTPLPVASPTAPPPGTSTVSFLVIVPATSSRTRPHVIVPSNATSVKFTIDSVNGTAYTGTPITETLAASNGACQLVSGQLSCNFNLSAPVGTLIYTVTVYNGSSVIAEGNVSLTTTNGATVNAPVTLSGTATKVAIAVGTGIAGIAASYPITVQAEDSNGNTILGTYTSAITLTDSDTSGATSITTAGSDNPPAGELVSSSDTATLNYNGAAMSSAATIGASASGVSASNVTTASFQPASNWLAQSGSVTMLGVTYEAVGGPTENATASPDVAPTSTAIPITVATAQTFGAATNLTGVTGLTSTNATDLFGLSSGATTYFAWSPSGNSVALGLVGYTDPENQDTLSGGYPENLYNGGEQSLTQTCASPYSQLLIVPFPSSWNVFSGAGACTTAYDDTFSGTYTFVNNANGSYSNSNSIVTPLAGAGEGTSTLGVDATGDVNFFINDASMTLNVSVPAPSPGASTVSVTANSATSTAPNPWSAIGLTGGTMPSSLLQDTMINKGAIGSLPAACAVMPDLVPASNPPLTEVDESVVIADPMSTWISFYTKETIKHYYLNGVGEICNENVTYLYVFDYYISSPSAIDTPTGGDIWAQAYGQGAALAWYLGVDQNWDSFYSDTYTYITQTTLTAVQSRVRDFTKVMPAAAQSLTAATYTAARSPMMNPRLARARPPSRSAWNTGRP
jgi:hypothetical protein